MFEAYAAGVNALSPIGGVRTPLPPEYALGGTTPEPWEPWHSVAGFKIRHVLMGAWQHKLSQAPLLARVGPRALCRPARAPAGRLPRDPAPRWAAWRRCWRRRSLSSRPPRRTRLPGPGEAGSNSWAVHGSRTTTGTAVLCNDSHRALDVPNVYWQVHVACPEFDVIGATFPGLPGFPHFGHNGHVAWNITHTAADYQDLYVEQFEQDGASTRRPEGWAPAERRRERIGVSGRPRWRSRPGARATARSSTATPRARPSPCATPRPTRPARLGDAAPHADGPQRRSPPREPAGVGRPGEQPGAADTAGSIGYLTRGVLPLRTSDAHRQFPAPGWTGEHEWVGRVPFEQMPRAMNPPEGYIATANQAVLEGDGLYIAHEFSAPFRAERIVEVIGGAKAPLSPQAIAALQGDVVSRAARAWARRLAPAGPTAGRRAGPRAPRRPRVRRRAGAGERAGAALRPLPAGGGRRPLRPPAGRGLGLAAGG